MILVYVYRCKCYKPVGNGRCRRDQREAVLAGDGESSDLIDIGVVA